MIIKMQIHKKKNLKDLNKYIHLNQNNLKVI